MSNSYGFDGNIPDDAIFGVYDIPNGTWTGRFFSSRANAQEAANELADEDHLGVVSVEGEDWIEPE